MSVFGPKIRDKGPGATIIHVEILNTGIYQTHMSGRVLSDLLVVKFS